MARRPLADVVAAAVAGGVRAVILREKDLPAAERAELARTLHALLAPVDGLLVTAGSAPLADEPRQVGRAGRPGRRVEAVHLSAVDPMPGPRPLLVGRSCHTAAEVAAAGAEGCDWVTVSPVHATSSKPGYGPALGIAGLRALTESAGAPPAYALGGVTAANAAECLAAGAYGVAVMGEVMRAEDPASSVAALLDRLRSSRDMRAGRP